MSLLNSLLIGLLTTQAVHNNKFYVNRQLLWNCCVEIKPYSYKLPIFECLDSVKAGQINTVKTLNNCLTLFKLFLWTKTIFLLLIIITASRNLNYVGFYELSTFQGSLLLFSEYPAPAVFKLRGYIF